MIAAQWALVVVFAIGVHCVGWIVDELERAADLAERPPVSFVASSDGSLVWVVWPPSATVHPPFGHPGG